MSTSVTMTYNGSSLSPVPIISIEKNYTKSPDSQRVGVINQIILDGVLHSSDGGLTNTIDLQRTLREIFDVDGQLFQISCDGSVIFETYPRVDSVSFEPSTNNWVNTIPYTVRMNFDTEPVNNGIAGSGEDSVSALVPPFLNSASEDWSIEISEDTTPYSWEVGGTGDSNDIQFKITHNVFAQGRRTYISGSAIKEGWEEAKDWVIPRLGFDSSKVAGSLVFNIDTSSFGEYNHMRQNTINEMGGDFGVSETWFYVGSGTNLSGAIEDFTATVTDSLRDPVTKINLQGTIRGLSTVDYGSSSGDYIITTNKYDAANTYWQETVGKLLNRAMYAGTGTASRSINPTPLNTIVGHNPTQGTITYSYEFDDRPCNFVSNALFENINIQDANPVDVFAELLVLGRSPGPILQDLNTVTSFKRNVTIDVLVEPSGGCDDIQAFINASPSTEVDSLLCDMETDLIASYAQLFKTQDISSWDGKTGKYNRQVQWTATNCGGSVDTSFC